MILVPKMVAVHFPQGSRGADARGSSVGVRVSGLNTSAEASGAPSHLSGSTSRTPQSASCVSAQAEGPPIHHPNMMVVTQQ